MPFFVLSFVQGFGRKGLLTSGLAKSSVYINVSITRVFSAVNPAGGATEASLVGLAMRGVVSRYLGRGSALTRVQLPLFPEEQRRSSSTTECCRRDSIIMVS